MRLKKIPFQIFLFISVMAQASGDPLIIPSSLQNVTVYRSGAELTHKSAAQLKAGNYDLVIEDISNSIDMNSVQVNCPSAVTIMGMEFSNNFLIAPEISSGIKTLMDSAENIQKDIDKVNIQIQITTDLIEVLKANRDIKGQQTGLSVSELIKLMDYYKNKSTELQHDLVVYRDRYKKLNEQMLRIKNQVREEESRNTGKGGRLKLQLSVASPGKYDFLVSYVTPNAWWSPYYDVRVDDINSPLKLIYKAKLAQTTGIDWKKVKLSLSTSVPDQWGSAPVLKTWFLGYINPINVMERNLAVNRIQSFEESMKGVPGAAADIKIRGYSSMGGNNTPLYVVNGVAMSAEDFSKISQSAIKNIEVVKGASATALYGSRASNGVVLVTLKDGLEDYVSITDNELNVNFDIGLLYDVPTNGKEQTATLKEYSVGSIYKYYAVPKLDRDAYLLAEVPDWEKLNLLPGDANIIFEGTYVGKSFIDPSSTADTLNLTLGRDKRVVVKKEKLADYSSVKFLGSHKLQKISFELTVKNNKKDTVRMILKDQYPLSTNKEIEVELNDDGGGMDNPDTGVLTWKLELAPGESRKIRFAYSVKYPKDRVLNL